MCYCLKLLFWCENVKFLPYIDGILMGVILNCYQIFKSLVNNYKFEIHDIIPLQEGMSYEKVLFFTAQCLKSNNSCYLRCLVKDSIIQ